VAKKLIDIKTAIDKSGFKFNQYLHHLLQDDIMEKLDEISKRTDVYIFSGIIRNYFLNVYRKRDVDVVIGQQIDIFEEFKDLPIHKNSFGGYKILFPSGPLDLWFIKDTWAFQHSQKTLNFNLEKKIPDTAFFNFSSIIYSLNNKQFHYNNHFVKFLRYKKLDYVYKENPNYCLCIINTLYYSERYNLSIADRLVSFISDLYIQNSYNYHQTQLKHFGEIIYTDEIIGQKIANLKSQLSIKESVQPLVKAITTSSTPKKAVR
jgi:hypothetical protein